MPDYVTLRLTLHELDYIKRAAFRDIEECELAEHCGEADELTAEEVARALSLLRVIERVEQEQVYQH